VEAGGDIAAANAMAVAGDVIDIAAGTYAITAAIEIKDGVTYQGAGAGLTIIDGGGTTRAFAATAAPPTARSMQTATVCRTSPVQPAGCSTV
jgi:hypothetical protein